MRLNDFCSLCFVSCLRRLPSAHPLHIHCAPYLPVQFYAFQPSNLYQSLKWTSAN